MVRFVHKHMTARFGNGRLNGIRAPTHYVHCADYYIAGGEQFSNFSGAR
jgi:hypothetical protein